MELAGDSKGQGASEQGLEGSDHSEGGWGEVAGARETAGTVDW